MGPSFFCHWFSPCLYPNFHFVLGQTQCFQHLLGFRGTLEIEVLSGPWYTESRDWFLVKTNEWLYSKEQHFIRKLTWKWAAVIKWGICLLFHPQKPDHFCPIRASHHIVCFAVPSSTDRWVTMCILALVIQQVQTADFLAVHPAPRYYSS